MSITQVAGTLATIATMMGVTTMAGTDATIMVGTDGIMDVMMGCGTIHVIAIVVGGIKAGADYAETDVVTMIIIITVNHGAEIYFKLLK